MCKGSIMEGVFIALDGSDALVTEVQFAMLVKNLRDAGHDVKTFDFTRLDQPSSYFVREFQRGQYGSDEEVGPYTGSVFYALDQYHAAPQIRDAVRAGKIVLARHYTASTMAEQGQKFVRSEERRGFFLWLEGMETRMFGLPRPVISIVLRATASAAKMDYPSLLTEAYDDLCQLFPKDYRRIDVARSGKILPEETVHTLILAKITPFLPLPSGEQPVTADHSVSQTDLSSETAKTSDDAPRQRDISHATLDISDLLASEIVSSYDSSTNDQVRRASYNYYVPEELDVATTSVYKEHLDRIYDIYHSMADKLAAIEGAKAYQILDTVLPVATTATWKLDVPQSELIKVIEHLGTIPTAEARSTARALSGHAGEMTPSPKEASPDQSSANQKIASLSAEYLASTYAAGDATAVELSDIWPRNEFNLLPHMLFEYSSLPLKDIRHSVTAWSYEQKAEVMQAYLITALTGGQCFSNALQMARYSWDVLCDYNTFRKLQSRGVIDYITRQPLTPRYGFDVPAAVDEAGLLDDFEDCFAISLKLHSILQQAGYVEQAQYATLLGHKMRVYTTINAMGAANLFYGLTSTDQGLRQFSSQMYDKLAEYHPLIVEAVQRNSK